MFSNVINISSKYFDEVQIGLGKRPCANCWPMCNREPGPLNAYG